VVSYAMSYDTHHHHHIYSPIITPHKKNHKNSHTTIGGLPERCLPVSPKPVSPKLGFRVRVGVSANRD